MKERIITSSNLTSQLSWLRIKLSLTSQPQTPYSKGGEIFMEGKGDMSSSSEGKAQGNIKITEQDPSQGGQVAKKETARDKVWKALDMQRKLRGEKISPNQLLTEKIMRESGLYPAPEQMPQMDGGALIPPGGGIQPKEEPPVQPPTATGGEPQGDDKGFFADIPLIPANEKDLERKAAEDLKDVIKDSSDEEQVRKIKEIRITQLKNAKNLIDMIERNLHLGESPMDAGREISRGIFEGKIDPVTAEPYLKKLAQSADKFRQEEAERRMPQQRLDAEKIDKLSGFERTKALKAQIEELDQDEPILGELLDMIAHDEEASEQFVAKVVGKPFNKPESDYNLSWYASINLESFFTRVGNIKGETKEQAEAIRDRYKRYAEQHETALRLHEANKATVTQSGNIEGLMNIARTITPERLQTGIEADGVEQARQIFDLAFGRLYGNYDRLKSESYKTEIVDWTEETFREAVARGEIKSRFKGEDGQLRSLEEWETRRAFALARNYHAALLRIPELVSWGNVPKPVEEWLKSPPAETLVRIMAGFKELQARFRSGITKGGPSYVALIFDNIAKKCNSKLRKIGVLDIRKDLLPVGLFSAGGFEKGWRPVGAYLNTKLMKINISKLRHSLPENTVNTKKTKKANARDLFDRFITEQKHGDDKAEVNLGELLIHNAEFAYEFYGQDIEINGLEIPKELTVGDQEKAKNTVEELLLPLMGFTVKPEMESTVNKLKDEFERDDAKIGKKVNRGKLLAGHFNAEGKYEYDYFNYNPTEDQVDFSLGVLISAGGISKNIKTVLWQKVAETMPLRIAYFLAEEGVKDIEGYNERVKGEKLSDGGYRLFSKDFESKLIRLHLIRMKEQKKTFEVNNGRHQALEIEKFFVEAGLTDLEEQKFVKELQKLGKEKAVELAEISFPHIPFLDDVPFQKAEYTNLGPEVYARRMNDERGYAETGNAAGAVVDGLELPYGEIKKHWKEALNALSGPEGVKTAQDVIYELAEPYFALARQWEIARIPGYRQVAEFWNKPTSFLQKWFTTNAYSWNQRMLNLNVRELAAEALIRNEQLPGESQSQVQKLLGGLKARPFNVFVSELVNALMAWFLYASVSFGHRTTSIKQ